MIGAVAILALVGMIGNAHGLVKPALRGNKFGIEPVPNFNASSYLGRWFQMAADAVVDGTFESDAYCVVADYGLNDNGTVSVRNSENYQSVNGERKIIYGWAAAEDSSKPAELTVHLQGVPFGAPYWVVMLGPVIDGKYDYAVVSDGLELSLFVLARDVERFQNNYEASVFKRLAAEGFDQAWNTPIKTVQSGCSYLPPPEESF